MDRLKHKYDNASKAFQSLKKVLLMDWQTNDVIRDSFIQRFEFTVETTWKLYQVYFGNQGLILNTPKPIFKQLLKEGILLEIEAELALDMVDDRNNSSHTYNEELAIEISNRIPGYFKILEKALNADSLMRKLEE